MQHPKHAKPDYPINELIASRWSPYVFDDRPISEAQLRSLFEAARWAASSYNEQPWQFIVATKNNLESFDRLLTCLVEPNQGWAKQAPVLALGVVCTEFRRNSKPNPVAIHDLGLAAATLTLEATARGISVHQMSGILPDTAKKTYDIPDGYTAVTALAIGYSGDADKAPEQLGDFDRNPRTRRPQDEFVFGANWGKPAAF
jgi:nitroreductase